jgi:hypothetical protein
MPKPLRVACVGMCRELYPGVRPTPRAGPLRAPPPRHAAAVIALSRRKDAPPAPASPADRGCFVKPLPERLWEEAARTATRLDPRNAAASEGGGAAAAALPVGLPPSALEAATRVARRWGPLRRSLTVGFVEGEEVAPLQLRERIVEEMNAWACTVSFVLVSGAQALQQQRRSAAGQRAEWATQSHAVTRAPCPPQRQPRNPRPVAPPPKTCPGAAG